MTTFFRFLATMLGISFALTIIVSTMIYAESATSPSFQSKNPVSVSIVSASTDSAPDPITQDPSKIEIIDKTTKEKGVRTTIIPQTGTKYKVGGKEFEFNIRDPRLRDVPFLILWIIEFFVGMAGIVAVFYLIYGGFQYFYELRHPSAGASSAQKTIYHAILGLVIVLVSYIFIATIVGGITGF